MSRHMSFIGQRADQHVVRSVSAGTGTKGDGVRRDGVVKEVEYYTMTCDECDGTGWYNYKGEVICDGCGLVLSGGSDAVIKTEYSEGDNDSMGRGRGLEKLDDSRGTHRPSI